MKKFMYLPCSIDADLLLQAHPRRDLTSFHLNYMCYVMTKELLSRLDRELGSNYVPIKTEYLRRVLGRRTSATIDFLVRYGVIKVDRRYIKGVRSRRYCFTDAYYPCKLKSVKLSLGQIRVIEKAVPPIKQKLGRVIFHREYVALDFESAKLTVDIESGSLFLEKEATLKKENLQHQNNQFQLAVIDHWKDNQIRLLELLQMGVGANFTFSDDFSGRLHSPLTRLKKELRKFLRWDGQPLMSLDIKNCQPFICLTLMNPIFWLSGKVEKQNLISLFNLDSELFNYVQESFPEIPSIMMGNSSETYTDQGFERSRFIEDTTSGKLYDVIAEELGQERKVVKEAVIKLLNGFYEEREQKKTIKAQIGHLMSNRYGIVMRTIQVLKSLKTGSYRVYGGRYEHDEGFTRFARLLQRIESFLVIDCIVQQLKLKYKISPVFTIHDMIITTEENIPIVEEVTNQVFLRHIGYTPRLAIEMA